MPPEMHKRQRVKRACIPCRQRKRKCDGRHPCGLCVAYEYECQFGEEGNEFSTFKRNRTDKKKVGLEAEPSISDIPGTKRSNTPDVTHHGILDPTKSRYMILHSAVAFPRSLGLELLSANPPRLHSFAWHCGIRPEEKPHVHTPLSEFVTKEEYHRFSKVYFSVVHPIFDIIDTEQLKQNAEKYWSGSGKISDFGAVIAGVIALGSFFSGNLGHPRELDIVQFAKGILDDPTFSRLPSVEQVSAWVLRTIYLRATARPHVAWLASGITVHLAEAIGLHHEIDKVDLASSSNVPLKRATRVCERARRLFWCAWSINRILSYDYGRSSVVLNRITCKPVRESNDNCTAHLIALAQLIPQENANSETSEQTTALLQALNAVFESPDAHPFLSLTKADICLSFYRRLRLLNRVLDKSVVLQIISIGNTALTAGYELAKIDEVWWNVLSTAFQYVCVLLALDTPDSLAHVAPAIGTLDSIAHVLGTHVAFEAQTTAKLLLQDSIKKKTQEVQQLQRATQEGSISEITHPSEIDWDALLDPSYTLSFM